MNTQANAVAVQTTTIKTLADAFKAEGKAERTLALAYDALYADSVRSAHLTKNAPEFNIDVFTQVQAAIIAGKLDKGAVKLFNMTPAEAKAANASALRNRVTSDVAKFIGNVRRALDQRDPVKQAEAAKAKAKAEAVKKSTGDAGEQEKADSAPKPSESVGKVNPRVSREAFCEALNVMVSACNMHEDKLIKAHRDEFSAVFTAMLAKLV